MLRVVKQAYLFRYVVSDTYISLKRVFIEIGLGVSDIFSRCVRIVREKGLCPILCRLECIVIYLLLVTILLRQFSLCYT